ncbi:hypothetical protein ABK040_001741 [Willaertia magna]
MPAESSSSIYYTSTTAPISINNDVGRRHTTTDHTETNIGDKHHFFDDNFIDFSPKSSPVNKKILNNNNSAPLIQVEEDQTTITDKINLGYQCQNSFNMHHKLLSLPEIILYLSLNDSGIVKNNINDIEELCMIGVFCEFILANKIKIILQNNPQHSNSKLNLLLDYTFTMKDTTLFKNENKDLMIDLLNEILTLISQIYLNCKDFIINYTIKDFIKVLINGKKIQHVTIYKIPDFVNRIGKSLNVKNLVDFKKTLFLFLSLPIKDKLLREKIKMELLQFLRKLNNEQILGLQQVESILQQENNLESLQDDHILGNYFRKNLILFSLIGIFYKSNGSILENDILKNELDKKELLNLVNNILFPIAEEKRIENILITKTNSLLINKIKNNLTDDDNVSVNSEEDESTGMLGINNNIYSSSPLSASPVSPGTTLSSVFDQQQQHDVKKKSNQSSSDVKASDRSLEDILLHLRRSIDSAKR